MEQANRTLSVRVRTQVKGTCVTAARDGGHSVMRRDAKPRPTGRAESRWDVPETSEVVPAEIELIAD